MSRKLKKILTTILKILDEYNVDLTAVGSVTTDNGANMLKTSQMLQDFQNDGLLPPELEDEETVSMSDETIMDFENDIVGILVPVRCASHTYHLAVLDVIKLDKYYDFFTKCRQVSKQLTTVKYLEKIMENNIKKVSLDTVTRWGSTYLMIKTIIENKEEYNEHGISDDLSLHESFWDTGHMFVEAFKPMYVLTKQIQSQNLIIGDMFKYSKELEIGLRNIPARNIFKTDLIRREKLFENRLFLAGPFLDPRFNFENTPYFPTNEIEPAVVSLFLWLFR